MSASDQSISPLCICTWSLFQPLEAIFPRRHKIQLWKLHSASSSSPCPSNYWLKPLQKTGPVSRVRPSEGSGKTDLTKDHNIKKLGFRPRRTELHPEAELPGSGVLISSTETVPQTSTEVVLDALLHACEIFQSSDIRERIFTLAHDAYLHHVMNTPRLSQLPFLITLNINIAMAKNAIQMGFKPEILCLEESISPFNWLGPLQYAPTYPQNLEPTSVQHQIMHHPWLDVFPFPRFRDNVIQAVAANLMDDDELCADVAEMNYEGTARPSLIVWGDPGDPSGWEASIYFLHKWGWLLQGCPELLEATNRWRECRGEKRLFWHDPQM